MESPHVVEIDALASVFDGVAHSCTASGTLVRIPLRPYADGEAGVHVAVDALFVLPARCARRSG